jgi:Fe-S-cluster containining protein
VSEAWYGDGLRFSCTRCGACCTGAPGYVWVNPDEIRQIAEFRGETIEQVRKNYVRLVGMGLSLTELPNGDCVFYDRGGRGCTIYPVRPRQCRSWPFWDSNLRTAEAWEETCQICPGAGRGEFVPREEVERRVASIRL